MNLGKAPAPRDALTLYKARVKESLPWIVSPMKGLKGREYKSFHVRHEASLIELFFDLFFVANLATFTAVHEITTGATVRAYIGFFVILWSTWFQITIFDVRFAQDSVYERFCKLYQFMAFVVLAAVGANFAPGDKDANVNFRIYQALTIVLGIVRFLLAIQYAVVAYFVVPKHRNLATPFILSITIFIVSGGVLTLLGGTLVKTNVNMASIVWWILLPIESICVMLTSSFWRMLSFKESHLNERLSLLTIIIIGEGVIGVTKRVGKMWPTDKYPDAGVIIEVLAIVILLLILWQAYFDNHPHGHYGTIKQQWWALSHFFLHLGYVGVVEGSNQMAIYYYGLKTIMDLKTKMVDLCIKGVSDESFVESLKYSLDVSQVRKYDSFSYEFIHLIFANITEGVVPHDDLCNSDLDAESTFWTLYGYMARSYMAKLGIEESKGPRAYAHTFETTYVYYWVSLAVSLLTLLGFLYVVRSRHQQDVFELIRMVWRLVISLVSIFMIFVYLREDTFYSFIGSPAVVPVVVLLMTLTVIVDRICRFFGMRRYKKLYGVPPPDEDIRGGHVKHLSYIGGDESPHSMLLSPVTPGMRPPYTRNPSTTSASGMTIMDYPNAYMSLDSHAVDGGMHTRPPYQRESSSPNQVGMSFQPGNEVGPPGGGYDIGMQSPGFVGQGQGTAYSSTYGGPFEPLRS